MVECNGVKSPMEKGLQLNRDHESGCDQPYRELLGSLMYLMLCSRPDICYPVSYMVDTNKIHPKLIGST